MSIQGEVLRHPINGTTEETWDGFSWPALFFGVIWLLVKGLYGHFLINLVVLVLSAGFAAPIVWIIYGFIGNGAHKSSLMKKGYLTNNQWDARNRPVPAVQPVPQVNANARPPAATPVLVADALEKLGALLDKGHLTREEFIEQKAQLLGKGSVPPSEPGVAGEPRDHTQLVAEMATPEKCKAVLISHGCRVSQPTEYVWEVLQPSGVTAFARSPEALQAIAIQFASQPRSPRAA